MKCVRYFIVGILFLAILYSTLPAQSMLIIPYGGLSKDMRSVTSNRWNMGFNFGLNIFSRVVNYLYLGGRVAYHHWSIDGQGWLQDTFPDYFVFKSASGSQSVFEFVPSLRYLFTHSESGLKVFVQAGLGFFVVSMSEVKVEGTYHLQYSYGEERHTYGNDTMIGFGIQLGLPIRLGKAVEIMPVYSPYLAGGDIYHHIAFNLGFDLGKLTGSK
jgi:hypothetical protein